MNSRASTALSRRSVLKSAAALPFLTFTPIPVHAENLQQASNPTPSTISRRFWDSFDGLAKLVQARMVDLGVPGSAFGVVHGTTRTTCTEGVTRVGTTIPVEPQTLFRVASLSKLFTGSAIASLVDAGAIDLDEPVHSYLPQFRVRDPAASERATIRHLVTHSAGWEGTLVYDPGPGEDALAQYVEHMQSLPQVTKPGEYFSYSNSAVILAGYLVAQVTGQTFESAVRDIALSPLSMEASSFLTADVTDQDVVFGHVSNGEQLIVVEPWDSVRAAAPTYGLLSNIDELLSFAAFHAKASLATPATYLSATAREQMHSPLGSGGSIGAIYVDAMGINWMLVDIGGTQVSLHAGNDFGQSSMIAVVPSEGFAVAILTNSDEGQSLALEAVLYALSKFVGLTMAERKVIDMSTSDLDTLTGKYKVPGGPMLNVTRAEDGLVLNVSINGEPVAEMSGPLVFVKEDLAELHLGGMPLLIDFIRDDGAPKWVRHLGQLATRVGG